MADQSRRSIPYGFPATSPHLSDRANPELQIILLSFILKPLYIINIISMQELKGNIPIQLALKEFIADVSNES